MTDVVGVAAAVTTAEILAGTDLGEALLAPWERGRLARIRLPERRADVLAARLLLRLCAARVTGRPPDAVVLAQRCAACGRAGHGRPYLPGRPDLGVSLSHADGLAAAAAGPGPVGIDTEPRTRRPGPLPVLSRLLPGPAVRSAATAPDPGPALLRLWVRHEALFKAGLAENGARLLERTDDRRGAVTAVASAAPVNWIPLDRL
ncbi:4-phosphopantetheinyl transferase [Streptomyces sp. NPDC004267]|uniref:4-phosphopantetheinyl transferase n=1 Tax=Streptomyces sp. NPDC004267 TaxID=3364694 RepID=UPI00367E858E